MALFAAHRRLAAVLLAFGFLILCALYHGFVLDDSFITYRYAKHLSEGHGLVFNIGEDPVEGYTTFLWVVLNAAAITASIDPVIFSKVCSELAALIIIWMLLCRCGGVHIGLAIVIGSAIALSPPFAFLAMQGMETAVTTLLLTTVAFISFRIASQPVARDIWMMYAVAFLSCLARPDAAPFLVGLSLGCFGILVARRNWQAVKALAIAWVVFGLLGIAYVGWRLDYFGYLFPNAFYIKIGASEGTFTTKGIEYATSFVAEVLLPYIVLFVVLAWIHPPRRRMFEAMPVLLGCGLFGLYLLTVTPIQGFFWRLVMPA